MATIQVKIHYHKYPNRPDKEPTTHNVKVADHGGPLYGEHVQRELHKQYPHLKGQWQKLEVIKGRNNLKEGALKDLVTKDEEEKRLLKTDKPKKVLSDKERSQLKNLQKKDKLDEARKVSTIVGRAFLNKSSKKSKNSHTDGKSLYLHGNEIAKHGENGAVHGTMAGWPTKTTKDRLNAISNDRFHTKKGKHYYGDKEIGERDWVQIKEAIRIMVEGAIKDLETKDEEEKRLLKINKPKKIMIDKERSQFKGLQKKDLKEDQLEEAKKLYVRKVQGDSRTRRNKKAWDLAFNPKKPVSFFDELKAINAKKEQEKKDLKEGVGRYLDKATGNQKRRIKNKLKHQNSMVSTPLSKIATNNKRLQRLEK